MRSTESLPRSCAIDCATRVLPAPVPPAMPIRSPLRSESGTMLRRPQRSQRVPGRQLLGESAAMYGRWRKRSAKSSP